MSTINPECNVFVVVDAYLDSDADSAKANIVGIFTEYGSAYDCMTRHAKWNTRESSSANSFTYEDGTVEIVGKRLNEINV